MAKPVQYHEGKFPPIAEGRKVFWRSLLLKLLCTTYIKKWYTTAPCFAQVVHKRCEAGLPKGRTGHAVNNIFKDDNIRINLLVCAEGNERQRMHKFIFTHYARKAGPRICRGMNATSAIPQRSNHLTLDSVLVNSAPSTLRTSTHIRAAKAAGMPTL